MSTLPHSTTTSASPRGDALQAIAMLVPAAVLAWPGPGSFLRDDFTSAATGSAVTLLACIPSLVVLALRRGGPARWWWLLLPLFAAGVFAKRFDAGLADTFERDRATCLVLVAIAMLSSGASLGARGRTVLSRALAALAIAFAGVGLLDGSHAHAGALGNTGSVSHAALAGGVIGAAMLAEERGPWRALHVAALVLQAAYVATVPVIAGAAASAGALVAFALLARTSVRTRVAAALAVLAIAGATAFSLASRAKTPASEATSARTGDAASHAPARAGDTASTGAPARAGDTASTGAPARAGNTGGIAVRRLVWSSTLRMIAAHPLVGVGLGQFARDFPPYRAPEEIELSTHQRRIAQETEVEHAHDDALTLLAEGGVVFAGGALVLLGLVAIGGVRKLRDAGAPAVDRALGAAAIALLANALVHGVLFEDPVSSSLAFGIFGALLGPVAIERFPLARRAMPIALLAVVLANASRALSLAEHARALAPIERGDELSSSGLELAVDRALEARADSTLAATLRARLLEERGADPRAIRSAWQLVRARRPLRVEALMQLGLAELRSGESGAASWAWTKALELDPHHPGLLWNSMTLAFDDERVADAEAVFRELDAQGRAPADRLLSLATRLELEAKESSAQALWSRLVPEIASAGPEKCFELAKRRRDEGDARLANALELRAQRGFAREHATHAAWTDAVRSYRQAIRVAADPTPDRMRVEYAAALFAAGKDEDARTELARVAKPELLAPKLPAWANAELAKHAEGAR